MDSIENLLETESILDYKVTYADMPECLGLISKWIATESSPMSFVCANPHSLYEASKDSAFQAALQDAELVTPDGFGVVLASKILGGKIKQRITGSDVFYGLNDDINKNKTRTCFFLGSTEEVLSEIKEKMAIEYPNIRVVGSYSPPFKVEFDETDNQLMVDAVNKAAPDILWVGMTAPKQEKWIAANKDKLNVKFVGAIGAVFDFYVGNVKRSSPIFQQLGLEWLPRLAQEPRRLWRRNFISSPMFLIGVITQKFNLKH